MQITIKDIETLTGKCPECGGIGWINEPWKSENLRPDCPKCLGTGQATIEIKKEWVECICVGKGYTYACPVCNSKGKIPKYKVEDEICAYCGELASKDNPDCITNKVLPTSRKWQEYKKYGKLKILSETEDKYKVIMVK